MLTASESIEMLVDWVQDCAQLLRTGSCGVRCRLEIRLRRRVSYQSQVRVNFHGF